MADSPTEEVKTFLDSLEPVIQFVAPKDDPVGIPKGLLTCCRVTHQADCQYHVALSLVGAATVRKFPDGDTHEWVHPMPVAFPGDILTEPTKMFAAIKTHWMLALETARRLNASVVEMTIGIFLLDAAQAVEYEVIHARVRERVVETIASYETMSAEQIMGLPIREIEDREEIQQTMLRREFRPVETYANVVLVVPNELGHDEVARYVDSVVWDAPEREAIVWQPDPEPKIVQEVVSLDPS